MAAGLAAAVAAALLLPFLPSSSAAQTWTPGRFNPATGDYPKGELQVAPNGALLGQSYALASNVSSAGAQPAAIGVPKDSYFFTCSASSWNSASAQLQFLGPDGVTFFNFSGAAVTSNPSGSTNPLGVGIGANSTVRVLVTGTPAGLYCSLT